MALAAMLLPSFASLATADDAAIYLGEPYDTIKLDEANRSALIKVQPLDLPDRIVPTKPKPGEELDVHLLDRPRKTFRVSWDHIVEVKLFERMVLDEAEQLVENKKLDDAYSYYEFLSRRYPKMPELQASYQKYLMAGAKEAFKQDRGEEALALLWDLHARNPEFKGAAPAILRIADRLIDKQFKQADYAAARQLLARVAATMKDAADPLSKTWVERLSAKAAELLAEASRAFAAKQFAAASSACRQAMAALPAVVGAAELSAKLRSKYLIVEVGVVEIAAPISGANDRNSWSSRRIAPLYSQSFAQLAKIDAGQAEYTTPLLKIDRGGDGKISLAIDGDKSKQTAGPPVTVYDLAAQLSAQATATSSLYRPYWADVFAGVSIDDRGAAQLQLKHPLARLEPWLDVPTIDVTGASGRPYRRGPTADKADKDIHWVEAAESADSAAPREIVERTFPDRAAAIAALRRVDVAIVDRVDPLEIAELAQDASLAVEAYATERIDLLVPNLRRAPMNNLSFRRALVHAIDRTGIVRQNLTRGKASSGFTAIDRLFAGRAPERNGDAEAAAAMRYDPTVANLMSHYALAEMRIAAGPGDGSAKPPADTIVLAHPADSTARLICQAIRRQLKAAGVQARLQEYTPDQRTDLAEKVDLMYVEWRPWEPLEELSSLLGADGLAGSTSGPVARMIREAATAPTSQAAAQAAGQLDQTIRDEALLIPLWKLNESIAYRRGLQGIGDRPVTLYQNVERWRSSDMEPAK